MCRAAIGQGIAQICFTEHCDLNPLDSGFNFFNFDRYSDEIKHAQDRYSGSLRVLKGIEFGEPHAYPREFEDFQARDFDFILGSVHWFSDWWISDKDSQRRHSTESIFEMYYGEVLKTVRLGGFDALAHIDFPKRYLGTTFEPKDLIEEILRELVKRDIALELNSSPLRKGLSEPYPSESICQLYATEGGTKVTVGSDAHYPEHVAAGLDALDEVISRHGFRGVHFEKRMESPL